MSSRLFKNPLLEAMTHVHPITPFLMWGPIAFWFCLRFEGGPGVFALWFVVGLLVWTFIEYFMHRWLFHYRAKKAWAKTVVFLFHGIHHKEPDDGTRLVMPPLPGFLLLSFFYGFFFLLLPATGLDAFMGSFLLGYLFYDGIHYAIHHWPMRSRIGRFLREHHMRHHHSCPNAKFGVSNPLWDYVFGTLGPK